MTTSFDANVLIYFLENDREFGKIAGDSFASALKNGRAEVSAIGVAEFFSHKQTPITAAKYKKLMNLIDVVPVDSAIAHQAGEIRQKHTDIKLPDALHIASAIHRKASEFVTNDERLYKKREIGGLKITKLS